MRNGDDGHAVGSDVGAKDPGAVREKYGLKPFLFCRSKGRSKVTGLAVRRNSNRAQL
jgi:hypothetical protein